MWIQTEILLRIGILCACFVYMLFRKCIREKDMIRINSYYDVQAKKQRNE